MQAKTIKGINNQMLNKKSCLSFYGTKKKVVLMIAKRYQ
jgi:hypothetical protein